MKILGVVLLTCGLAWNMAAQIVAPAVSPLTAFGGTLQAPARVATDQAGNVYVSDTEAGQVVVFDPFGCEVEVRTIPGKPLGLAIDAQGQIYLSDQQAGSVSVFSSQWDLLYKLGAGAGEFQMPNHIALGPPSSGPAVYVSDSMANLVKVYRGPALINQFGSAGTNSGQFDFPAGVCVSSAGQVFVVDQNNDRVEIFDSAGSFLWTFNLNNSSVAGRAQAALLDNALRLYVADAYQGTVKVFDSGSGAFLANIGSFGESPGQLSAPGGLALDRFNRLCVASANNGRVELYGLDSFLHVSANLTPGAIPAGTNLVLAALTGVPAPLAFQWQRNGQTIPGATNSQLTVSSVGPTDAGNYTVVITSASGSITSSIASFTVMTPPTIVSGPQNRAVLSGTDVVFKVDASGTALGYQWFYNEMELVGATNSSLELLDVQPYQAGEYFVRVQNALGIVTSPTALLTVMAAPLQMELVSGFIDPDRLLHLTLNVDPGYNYTLEATTNFTDWQPLTLFTNDAGGLLEFIDNDSTNFWSRFYRIQWQP